MTVSILGLISAMCHGYSAYQADLFDTDIDSHLGKAEGYCMNQAIFSFLSLLLISGSISTLDAISGSYDISPCFFKAVHIVALLSLISALVLFVAIYFEKKLFIKIIVGFSAILALLSLICGVMLVMPIYSFAEEGKSTRICQEQLLPSLNRDYIANAGCNAKYISTVTTKLECPKKEIKFVWEENYAGEAKVEDEDNVYGCLNISCCEIIIADIKFILTGSLVSCAVMSLVILLTCVAAYKFQATAKELGRNYLTYNDLIKGNHVTIFGIIVLALLILGMAYNFMKEDHIPQIPDFLVVDPLPANIDTESLGKFEKYLTAELVKGSFPIITSKITENKSDCGRFCDDFIYHTTISVKDESNNLVIEPEVLQNKDILIDKDLIAKDNTAKIFKFKGWYKDLNKVISLVKYKPSNPIIPSKINIDIKVRQEENFQEELTNHWGGDRRLRMLDNDFYSGENPLYPFYSKEVTFELFSPDKKVQYIGRLIQQTTSPEPIPVVDATIIAKSPEIDNYVIFKGNTSDTGKFTMQLPLFIIGTEHRKIIPYTVKIMFTKPGFCQ